MLTEFSLKDRLKRITYFQISIKIRQSMSKLNQKQIQDLFFSNETFFGVLSSLQSIYLFYTGKHSSGFADKLFKGYDCLDYKDKSLAQLKSQLWTQINLFQFSILDFKRQKKQWKIVNFPEKDAKKFIKMVIQTLEKVGDKDTMKMAEDILRLMKGEVNGLNIENMNMDVEYSQEEEKRSKADLLKNALFSGQRVHKLTDEAKQFQDENGIKPRVNKNNSLFQDLQFFQGSNKSNYGQFEKTIIYLALEQRFSQKFKEFIGKKPPLLDILHQFSCFIFENDQQLYQNISKNILSDCRLLVSVTLDKEQRIQKVEQCKKIPQKGLNNGENMAIEVDQKGIERLINRNYVVFFVTYAEKMINKNLLHKPFGSIYRKWKLMDNAVEIFQDTNNQRFQDSVNKIYEKTMKRRCIRVIQVQGRVAEITDIDISIMKLKETGKDGFMFYENVSTR